MHDYPTARVENLANKRRLAMPTIINSMGEFVDASEPPTLKLKPCNLKAGSFLDADKDEEGKFTRRCSECGKAFTTSNYNKLCCSPQCSRERSVRMKRERRANAR